VTTWPTRSLALDPSLRPRIGGLAWLLTLQYVATEIVARLAWRGPFDWRTNWLSDLGVRACTPAACSPLHDAVNASTVLLGLLAISGAVLGGRTIRASAAILIVLAGVGTAVAGAVPADLAPVIHLAGALCAFFLSNAALVVLGLDRLRESKAAGICEITSGVAGLAGCVLLMCLLGGCLAFPWGGSVQRLVVLVPVAAFAVRGAEVVRRPGRCRPSREPTAPPRCLAARTANTLHQQTAATNDLNRRQHSTERAEAFGRISSASGRRS
jgi:hypothetical membrane protein